MSNPSTPTLCECGCGEPAPIAPQTRRKRGWVKGQPLRFRQGHSFRSAEHRTYLRSPEHRAHLVKARAARKDARPLAERIAAKVTIDPATGCHVWHGATSAGYGMVYFRDGRMTQAHRAAFELRHGRIPEGHHLHHVCRNPLCVNPAHLLPVPAGQQPAVHRAEDAIVKAIQAGEAFDPPAASETEAALDSVGALSHAEALRI